VLDLVGLDGKEDRFPHQLSGGEQQRVSVARAFVNRPLILIADEPTGNLDPDTADTVLGLLARTIRAQGAAGILVTHSMHAAATADRVLRLDHGRLRVDPFAPT
jgi:putative ABC transport system ATP-binding protein